VPFCLLEISLRIAGYPYQQVEVPDTMLHHVKKPGSQGRYVFPAQFSVAYSINSHGMRDKVGRSLGKPEGTHRVLVFGDSFVEGFGVKLEETFCYRAEAMLNANPNRAERWEIINAGQVSYSPLLEHLYYRKVGRQFSPDLVILFLDWSDLQDDHRYRMSATYGTDGEIEAVIPDTPPTQVAWGLARYTALVNFFFMERPDIALQRIVVRPILQRILGQDRYLRLCDQADKSRAMAVRPGDLNRDRYMIFRDEYVEGLTPQLEFTQSNIFRLFEVCKQDGVEFLLVLYPYAVQLNGLEWAEGRGFWGFEAGKVYGDKLPFQIFETFAKMNGIPVLNLLPAFKASSTFPLFYSEDGHWTSSGHALVAETLVKHLRRN
jgi:hypothetical protein